MGTMAFEKDYMATLRERSKKSRVYKKHQMTGLMLSEMLGDEKHKALYIKLAREHGHDKLVGIAGNIRDNMNVKNKGAYFMRVLFGRKSKTKPKEK
jgi:hypothetical protein